MVRCRVLSKAHPVECPIPARLTLLVDLSKEHREPHFHFCLPIHGRANSCLPQQLRQPRDGLAVVPTSSAARHGSVPRFSARSREFSGRGNRSPDLIPCPPWSRSGAEQPIGHGNWLCQGDKLGFQFRKNHRHSRVGSSGRLPSGFRMASAWTSITFRRSRSSGFGRRRRLRRCAQVAILERVIECLPVRTGG